MNRIKKIVKRNYKTLIAYILGLVITGGSIIVYASIAGTNVTYTDTNSIGATTVQGAIDKLVAKTPLSKRSNFIIAYKYNASTCVTGEESTCQVTTCYKTKSANSCGAGTIIKYKVRPSEVVTFHVMYDDASTITMQAQKNTVYNIQWYSYESGKNTAGPLTALEALESATAGWSNVNDITYTAGTTKWGSMTNAYTGCNDGFSCEANKYTLPSRTAKARMITLQEANAFGCIWRVQTCPKWMYNYLYVSTSYGGTINDTSYGPYAYNSLNEGYWLMSAYSNTNSDSWYLASSGGIWFDGYCNQARFGARAVVVVNK